MHYPDASRSVGLRAKLADIMSENESPWVGIIMGSKSDWETMRLAAEVLENFGVPHECRVVSAHRTPEWMVEYAKTAEDRGLEVLIAGAGGGASAGDGGLFNIAAGVGRAGEKPGPVGIGFAAVHRANARRRARGNLGDRRIRREKRRAAGGANPRQSSSRTAGQTADVSPRANRQNFGRFRIMSETILPGAALGVLGSGQLGRMFAIAAPAQL